MSGGQPLRVLIADDSAVYRSIVKRCVESLPGLEVVGMAANGAEAVEGVRSTRPDLLLLDVAMPLMDGPQALRELRRLGLEVPTIVISGLEPTTARQAIEAVRCGAFEFVAKPQVGPHSSGAEALGEPLARAIAALLVTREGAGAPAEVPPTVMAPAGSFDVLVVTASTGGPAALGRLIPELSAGFPLPILVVQHMPAGFSEQLVQALGRGSRLQVCEGQEGAPIQPGRIVLAPGDRHMSVGGTRMHPLVHLDDGPPLHSCRPAADRLFESAAVLWGARTLGLVMTGMGSDGLAGARVIRAAGGAVLCQDQDSCAVYGMPRALLDAGEADEVVALDGLAERIQFLAGDGGARWAS